MKAIAAYLGAPQVERQRMLRIVERPSVACQNHIQLPLPQLLNDREVIHGVQIEHDPRIFSGKFLNDWLENGRRNRLRTADPDFTGAGVSTVVVSPRCSLPARKVCT